MTETTITLRCADGDLYLPDGQRLLIRYPEGDCDSIPWPMTEPSHLRHLACALFDEREMGGIPARATEVFLPDGTLFVIDA